MNNFQIAELFDLYAKLSDVHDADPFKTKSYAAAAFRIEKMPVSLAEIPTDAMGQQDGIGKSLSSKIIEILQRGSFSELDQLLANTPTGILEMFKVKGIGPKKIRTLWKELQISDMGELEYACTENRLAGMKGFGQKTQSAILESIQFLKNQTGKFHYATAESWVPEIEKTLNDSGWWKRFQITGDFRRDVEVIESLEWVVIPSEQFSKEKISPWAWENEITLYQKPSGMPELKLHLAKEDNWGTRLVETTGNLTHLQNLKINNQPEEEIIYSENGWPFIPPCLREGILEKKYIQENLNLIKDSDLKGVIHNHSTWSDGLHSLEDMARYARELGFQYLVICDHSKTASYANGLQPERVKAQWQEIEILNTQLAPFKIYKGIESDILGDGSLDYEEDLLKGFEVVVASIHQNLSMSKETAMSRLLKAIENPYTRILGHMTGRLLLSRPGYPLDHQKIIDACIANHVVIELNAHPYRLDVDWRWIPYILEKGGMISINPDAHQKSGYHDMQYGTKVARKGGAAATDVLNSKSLADFQTWVSHK